MALRDVQHTADYVTAETSAIELKLRTDAEVVGYGYRKGFDRDLQLMTEHAWEMNNPNARMATLEMVMRFELIRFEIASDEDGKIRTLRARKFVV